MKVKAYIEVGLDGTYDITFGENNPLPFGSLGQGNSIKEAIEDFEYSTYEMLDNHIEKDVNFPKVLEFEYIILKDENLTKCTNYEINNFSSNIEEFKLKLIEEYIHLSYKVYNLKKCFNKDSTLKITPYETMMLKTQYSTMKAYQYILEKRMLYYDIITINKNE